jgi:hypothetical protein
MILPPQDEKCVKNTFLFFFVRFLETVIIFIDLGFQTDGSEFKKGKKL